MKKLLTILTLLLMALTTAWAGEQTILITSSDASGVYYTSKGGVKMEMSGGMNNEGFMVQRHYDQINFRSFNFKIKKIVFRCLDNTFEGDNDSFYWGPTTMYIAPNTSVNNVVAGTLTTPYNNSTYMAKWESSPTYNDGLPIGQQLTIKCQGHPVRFAYIEITIDKEDGDMYELVTNTNQIVTGDKTYMLVHRRQSTDTQGDAFSSNQEDESTSGNFESTKVDLFNNGFLARATGDVMFLRFSTGGTSSYPYRIIAGGAYLRTESSDESSPTSFATKRLTRVANVPSNNAYVNTSLGINSSSTGGTNGFDWYAMLTYEATTGYRIRHYNGKMQFRNITSNSTQNTNLALQRVFLYKPAQKYEVYTATDGNGTITLRDGVVVDGTHNYSQMMDNVSFIVSPAAGYKIKNVTITNLTDNTEITPTITTTTLGQNYAFSMPGSDVRIYAEFEAVQYRNITMEVKPSSLYGNIFLTDGYIVQGNDVMSYEGEDVAFNVTANYINIDNEGLGKYTLSYVSVTNHATNEETILAASEVGKYNFTMPDADVTITAYFYDDTTPLYLLGTANGETGWHTYGPRFNYDSDQSSNHYGEYYIDVYFKGTGDYASNTGDNWGEFRVTWLVDPDDNWGNIKNKGKQGHPYKLSVDPLTNKYVCQNGGKYHLSNGDTYGLNYDYGSTEYDGEWTDQEDYKFTVDPGIYRFYVGTQISANAGHLGLNVLKVEERPIALTFDPAGGASANEAVEVPLGQGIILAGDLYNKIKAINPNEADANFKYKYDRSIDGTSYTGDPTTESAGASTTTTLTEANEGITVTKLEAHNYLGWIVADNNAYYKVIDTPLEWIEVNGTPGEKYTVSNELLAVYRANNSLWCKDMFPYKSYAYRTPFIPDYMVAFAEQGREPVGYDENDKSIWDQSNWVELDFSNLENGASIADDLKGKKLAAGTVKGVYSKPNHKIVLTSAPTEGQALAYVPNSFCPVNFLDKNIDNDGAAGANNTNFFFVNPKVQEYAVVTMAVWVGDNKFVVPAYQQNGEVNGNDFDGAFNVNWTLNNWDCFNEDCPQDQSGKLNQAESDNGTQAYHFHAIIRVPESSKANGPARINVTPKPDQTPSDNYMIFPLDLIVNSDHIITAVSHVNTAKAVHSVTYSDLAGRTSSKPFAGVNIVITRYTDGTVITSKQVR